MNFEFDTEQEAAYAYNVATVLMAPVSGQELVFENLNLGLRLTFRQARHVEDTVSAVVRKKIGLPKQFKFPAAAKTILSQTCEVILP